MYVSVSITAYRDHFACDWIKLIKLCLFLFIFIFVRVSAQLAAVTSSSDVKLKILSKPGVKHLITTIVVWEFDKF